MGRWRTVGLILMLAFGARIIGLPALRHNYDHSFPIAQAALGWERGLWSMVGQRSTLGFPASPMSSWLIAPVLGIGAGPWLPHFMAVALDVLAIALVYRIARAAAPAWLARLAATLAAFSPWHIYFARGTWLPAWFPFFVALALFSWSPFLARGRSPSPARIGMGWVGITLAALVHPVGLLLIPPALLSVWWMPGGGRLQRLGAACMLIVVLMYGITAWRAWEGPRSLRLPSRFWPWQEVAFAHAMRMVSGKDFAEVWMGAFSPYDRLLVRLSRIIALGIELSIALAVAESVARGIRQRNGHGLLLSIWWGFPALWLAFPWPYPIHIHYLAPTMPVGALLAIWPWRKLPPESWKRYPIEAWAWGAALVWVIILFAADRNARMHPWTGNVEELPLSESAVLAQRLIRWLERDHRVQVVLPSDCAETTPTWLMGLVGRAIDVRCGFHPERLAFAHTRHPTLMLLYGRGRPPALKPLRRDPEWVRWMPDGGWLALYEVLPEEIRPSRWVDVSTDLGWRLLGYDLEENGDRLTVTTYWQIERIPSDPMRWAWHYQPFHHLLDPEEHQLQNPSGWGVPGYLWRIGDIYIDRTELAFPRGAARCPLRLELGLFDPNRSVRARFLLPAGDVETLVLKRWDEGGPCRER